MRSLNINTINGLLGTIVVHLLIVIIFLYAKIAAIYVQNVQIKVETPETIKEELSERKMEQTKKAMLDKMVDAFIASQHRSNIGVNISGGNPVVSEKDLEQTQEEVDAAQKQLADIQENLDKQEKLVQSATKDGEAMPVKKTEKIQGKLAVYKGPTNIYFDLPGRNDVYLYVPVYKCEGNGQVVVNISVNQNGIVENASIDKLKSDQDDCLFEAAYDAALRSKFNSDFTKAPQKQKGTLTYLFVAQ